ncbi:MAG: NAD-dependent epimerase/dehydratase family protein [Synergistaceae bacterium]|nr:NAD-dependent epimerase/dehydratase family protein [Synergistaceae bacterium]
MEACVRQKASKVVFISSGGTVYGKESICPVNEDTPARPITSYGIQKITIERLLYLYHYVYGLDYRIIRLANPYGPYQRPNGRLGAATTFIHKALNGEKIHVFGDGSVVRDFIYIDDAVRGIVNIANGESAHRTFNLGSGHGTSIKQLIDTIQDTLNVKLDAEYEPARKIDVPVNYLDISRYEAAFGALNPISLKEGIKRTADFMKSSRVMRVCVVMGKVNTGGKKNLVMEYYRHMDREKVQLDFLCDSDSSAIPYDEIESLGGRVYIIPPYQNIIANMKAIMRICRENRYTVMHGYNSTMNVFAMLAGKLAGVRVRINESISMGHKGDKRNILKNILRLFPSAFSTHFAANGEECGIWQFGRKITESENFVLFRTVIDAEKNKFDPELRARTRKELGLENNIVIGYIGRFVPQKNTLFLVDIFAEIVKREPRSRLLLIGDGKLKDDMMHKIHDSGIDDKVVYLGMREDIQKFYNAMDCFLLPSLYEGLSVAGVEAECCGLPVFFSDQIPAESSPCDDLGVFIGLDKSASEWSDIILSKLDAPRTDHSSIIKSCGYDSKTAGHKLTRYYSILGA